MATKAFNLGKSETNLNTARELKVQQNYGIISSKLFQIMILGNNINKSRRWTKRRN